MIEEIAKPNVQEVDSIETQNENNQLKLEGKQDEIMNKPLIYFQLNENWTLKKDITQECYYFMNQVKDFSTFSKELKTYIETVAPEVKETKFYENSQNVFEANEKIFKHVKQVKEKKDFTEEEILEEEFLLYLKKHANNFSHKTIEMYGKYIFSGKNSNLPKFL